MPDIFPSDATTYLKFILHADPPLLLVVGHCPQLRLIGLHAREEFVTLRLCLVKAATLHVCVHLNLRVNGVEEGLLLYRPNLPESTPTFLLRLHVRHLLLRVQRQTNRHLLRRAWMTLRSYHSEGGDLLAGHGYRGTASSERIESGGGSETG